MAGKEPDPDYGCFQQLEVQISTKPRPRTRALRNATGAGKSQVWESDSVLKYYFQLKAEGKGLKRNFVSTRIPKGLVSPPEPKLSKVGSGTLSVIENERLGLDDAALASYF